MKKIILILALAFITQSIWGQVLTPVKWSYAAKRTNSNEAVVMLRAIIDEGWHIYSINQAKGGPVKTSFKFVPAASYILIGKVNEPAPVTKFDDTFGINVKYFEKEVVFQQKVRLRSSKPVTIKGKLTYMVCTDHQCIPATDVNFVIPIN